METRRTALGILAAGITGLAGCSSQTSTGNEDNGDTTAEEQQELAVPFDGLGAYEDSLREAGGIDEPIVYQLDGARDDQKMTSQDIVNMLEETNSVEEEQQWLTRHAKPGHLPSIMNEYHKNKEEGEPMVVANQNTAFMGSITTIGELYTATVNDGEYTLNSQPSINVAQGTRILTHFPGEEEPSALANLRQTRGAGMVPSDYNALQERIEYAREHEDATEEEIRGIREYTFKDMSAMFIGVGPDEDVIAYDGDTANTLTAPLQEDNQEAAEALVTASKQLPEAESYETDTTVSAEYTGDDLEFRTHENWEYGDRLPGEQ